MKSRSVSFLVSAEQLAASGSSVIVYSANARKVDFNWLNIKKIIETIPFLARVIYIHCHAHLLKLSLQDACSSIKDVHNFLGTAISLYDFLEDSANLMQSSRKYKQVWMGVINLLLLVKVTDLLIVGQFM